MLVSGSGLAGKRRPRRTTDCRGQLENQLRELVTQRKAMDVVEIGDAGVSVVDGQAEPRQLEPCADGRAVAEEVAVFAEQRVFDVGVVVLGVRPASMSPW